MLQAVDKRTVRELNARIRSDRIAIGDAAPTGLSLHDGLTAGVGDRIVTRRNHRRLTTADGFVRNGALWDVTTVLTDGSLRVRSANRDDAPTVRVPAAYVAEHVALGHATTIARTQGMTLDETHTIATPGMGREDLYVAMSRGRHTNRTYVVVDQPNPECLPARRRRRAARCLIRCSRPATPNPAPPRPGTPTTPAGPRQSCRRRVHSNRGTSGLHSLRRIR